MKLTKNNTSSRPSRALAIHLSKRVWAPLVVNRVSGVVDDMAALLHYGAPAPDPTLQPQTESAMVDSGRNQSKNRITVTLVYTCTFAADR